MKIELSFAFTINLFTIAEKLHGNVNCLIKTGFSLVGNNLRPSKNSKQLNFSINSVVWIVIC